MNVRTYDVCVVGGGPAGSVFATLASRTGQAVVLLHHPGTDARVDTLSSEARELLAQHRFTDLGNVAVASSGHREVWRGSSTGRRPAIARPGIPGCHVSRAVLAEILLEAARDAGVTIVASKLEGVSRETDGYRVETARGTARAARIVDATGAAARVARMLGVARHVLDLQIAIIGRLVHPLEEHDLVLASWEHGWVYATPCADGTQVVALTDRDGLRGRSPVAHLRDAARMLPGVADASVHAAYAMPVPLQLVPRAPGHPRFESLGDASWSPDPLSGQGTAHAIAAALSLVRNEPRCVVSLALEHLRQRTRLLARTPWAHAPYYRNRTRAHARAEEILHDDSSRVEHGVGAGGLRRGRGGWPRASGPVEVPEPGRQGTRAAGGGL